MNSETQKMSKKQLADRIRTCATMVGSGDELSRRTGVPRRTLENYLSGKSVPKAPVLAKIAEEAGVSLEWLATGLGEKVRSDAAAAAQKKGGIDPVLLGRIMAEVHLLFVEENHKVSASNLAATARAIYEKVFDVADVEAELAGEINIELNRLRRAIRSGRLSGSERS